MENKEVVDILGETPIGYTPNGDPIYSQEESDYDLRRRIQGEQAENKRSERGRLAGIKFAGIQQRATDNLMKVSMGKNWGRRR